MIIRQISNSKTKIYSAIIKMISWGGDEYEIDLSENDYMLEGNRLFDKTFIKYWLKNYSQEELMDDDIYCVTFFDQDMEQVTIDEGSYIILTKDSYKIEREDDSVENLNDECIEEAKKYEILNK